MGISILNKVLMRGDKKKSDKIRNLDLCNFLVYRLRISF